MYKAMTNSTNREYQFASSQVLPRVVYKTRMKLLGAAADMQMHNLEVCVESAYDRNGKIPRLVRPTVPKYLRKKRAVVGHHRPTTSSLAKSSQVFCSRTKKEFILPAKCSAP
ncbi:uncharacterized protein LOC110845450 isoform X2 [Folsomia candida]|uniref:uncharacterized protein LOC110845450 isoform X2 n=1 Tax=Folsomia candida TaxID=158441 RepID=UPI001604DCCB|nr:uncharacterized protein LOC110845450 isoform X2 [Folsomia candida]